MLFDILHNYPGTIALILIGSVAIAERDKLWKICKTTTKVVGKILWVLFVIGCFIALIMNPLSLLALIACWWILCVPH